MRIQEACKVCNLTKKAIEYYIEQGLLCPAVMENGYRDFSQGDIERLQKIAILRGLGLAVSDIQMVLDNRGSEILRKVFHKKDVEIIALQAKQSLLEQLARGNDWENIRAQLVILERKQSILQRLSEKFPGFYGSYIRVHFARFLDEPIETADQQDAFETIISYLDGLDIVIPDDLTAYLDEMDQNDTRQVLSGLPERLSDAYRNIERFMADNKEELEAFMALMNTDAFKQSPAYRLKEFFKELNRKNGYNDVFIPAMVRLSNAYRQYHDDLVKANDAFLNKYGDTLNE